MADGLDAFGLDLTQTAPHSLAALFPAPVEAIGLEIGFGGGEHLLHRARTTPHVGFIGVEPFINGMAKVTSSLCREPLGNLRLFADDATRLLDWLPDSSISRIDLLYPDPWPKRKHWKRRFVCRDNLDRFARVMVSGGCFCFASDIDSYVNWTLCHVLAHPDFEWQAQGPDDWRRPFYDWPGTRYEAKALRAGRRPAYLTIRRI